MCGHTQQDPKKKSNEKITARMPWKTKQIAERIRDTIKSRKKGRSVCASAALSADTYEVERGIV